MRKLLGVKYTLVILILVMVSLVIPMSKLRKLHTLNICSLFDVDYTSINLLKIINFPIKKIVGPFTFTGDFSNILRKKKTSLAHSIRE